MRPHPAQLVVLALTACKADPKPDIDAPPPVIDADLTVDAPTPRETMMLVQPLQAGELVEAIMTGGTPGAGDRAIFHLVAPTANLDWNVHSHPNGGTVNVHEEFKVMDATYDFIPAEHTDWFLLLRNSGPVNMDVQVEVKLFGTMTFAFL